VRIWGFSRINFVRTLLSKRKLQALIDARKATGWDDPRFPTVAGIMRRGMTVAGLKTFILSMGASTNTNLMQVRDRGLHSISASFTYGGGHSPAVGQDLGDEPAGARLEGDAVHRPPLRGHRALQADQRALRAVRRDAVAPP
jgi:hypothetical protein